VFTRIFLACTCLVVILVTPFVVRTHVGHGDVHTTQTPDRDTRAMHAPSTLALEDPPLVAAVWMSLPGPILVTSSKSAPAPVRESEALLLGSLGLLMLGAARLGRRGARVAGPEWGPSL
jgi:hypothetical protein